MYAVEFVHGQNLISFSPGTLTNRSNRATARKKIIWETGCFCHRLGAAAKLNFICFFIFVFVSFVSSFCRVAFLLLLSHSILHSNWYANARVRPNLWCLFTFTCMYFTYDYERSFVFHSVCLRPRMHREKQKINSLLAVLWHTNSCASSHSLGIYWCPVRMHLCVCTVFLVAAHRMKSETKTMIK